MNFHERLLLVSWKFSLSFSPSVRRICSNLKSARRLILDFFFYINTSEVPGELSRVNMISSHMKITCYFTLDNNDLRALMYYPLFILSGLNTAGCTRAVKFCLTLKPATR